MFNNIFGNSQLNLLKPITDLTSSSPFTNQYLSPLNTTSTQSNNVINALGDGDYDKWLLF